MFRVHPSEILSIFFVIIKYKFDLELNLRNSILSIIIRSLLLTLIFKIESPKFNFIKISHIYIL